MRPALGQRSCDACCRSHRRRRQRRSQTAPHLLWVAARRTGRRAASPPLRWAGAGASLSRACCLVARSVVCYKRAYCVQSRCLTRPACVWPRCVALSRIVIVSILSLRARVSREVERDFAERNKLRERSSGTSSRGVPSRHMSPGEGVPGGGGGRQSGRESWPLPKGGLGCSRGSTSEAAPHLARATLIVAGPQV